MFWTCNCGTIEKLTLICAYTRRPSPEIIEQTGSNHIHPPPPQISLLAATWSGTTFINERHLQALAAMPSGSSIWLHQAPLQGLSSITQHLTKLLPSSNVLKSNTGTNCETAHAKKTTMMCLKSSHRSETCYQNTSKVSGWLAQLVMTDPSCWLAYCHHYCCWSQHVSYSMCLSHYWMSKTVSMANHWHKISFSLSSIFQTISNWYATFRGHYLPQSVDFFHPLKILPAFVQLCYLIYQRRHAVS